MRRCGLRTNAPSRRHRERAVRRSALGVAKRCAQLQAKPENDASKHEQERGWARIYEEGEGHKSSHMKQCRVKGKKRIVID